MATKTSELYQEEIKLIENEILKELTVRALDSAPKCISWIPASSSGKFHPKGDIVVGEIKDDGTIIQGGLVNHTKADVSVAKCMIDCEIFREFVFGISEYPMLEVLQMYKDVVYVSLILHDSVKGLDNDPKHKTIFDHPLKASELFKTVCKEYFADNKIDDGQKEYIKNAIPLIVNCISSHMGEWNTASYAKGIVLPTPKTNLELFVHMCDYLGSRKYIDIDLEKYYGR